MCRPLVRFTLMAFSVAFSVSALFAFQAAFRPFPAMEDDPVPVPSGANEKTERAFTRLMYPSGVHARVFGGIGIWLIDYPKADRQFVQGVRRLTRIHTRSSEQVVDPDRPIVEIDNQDPIFHVLYDLGEKIQVPGIPNWYSG